MAGFKFTQKAVLDITEIWEYTLETWSEKQADKYYQFLIQSCAEIAANPEMGKPYNEVRPGLLGQQVSKHIIFYHIKDKNSIEVVRILHERMNLRGRLHE